MHGAAYKQVPSVAQFLIDKGAKVQVWNHKDAEGVTPLMIAEGVFVEAKVRPPLQEMAAVLRKAMAAAGASTIAEQQDLNAARVREKEK